MILIFSRHLGALRRLLSSITVAEPECGDGTAEQKSCSLLSLPELLFSDEMGFGVPCRLPITDRLSIRRHGTC
jgi:hypothetical protein